MKDLSDVNGVMLQITKVANLTYDLQGWLWAVVIEELWDTSHDQNCLK